MCREYFYSRNGREKDALIKFDDDEDNFDDTLRISPNSAKKNTSDMSKERKAVDHGFMAAH